MSFVENSPPEPRSMIAATVGVAIAVFGSVLALVGSLAAAGSVEPTVCLSYLLLVLAVFLGIPFVIAAGIGAVVTVLLAVLMPMALLVGATGRPTGFSQLAGEAFAIPAIVVPGYYGALGRVRSPVVWGLVFGVGAAAVALLSWSMVWRVAG